ncbi:feruloyl-CoA synthetase [Devosia sp. 17-2-E-8]|nr:feruloyl-CoA synthetase [Devosia sp. 17-2-E-8]
MPQAVDMTTRADGSIILRSKIPLARPVDKTSDWLHRWAAETPQAVFLAERSGEGWRELRYAEVLGEVRAIAASLLGLGLGPNRPIVVLSGNGVDHGLLALAAQYVGIPLVPLAEQYSLIPGAHARLSGILDQVRPGAVFVSDTERFAQALELDALKGLPILASRGGNAITMDAIRRAALGDVDAANRAVGPDTLAKIVFTSGSTSAPKGVLTTHRMLCVNQMQMGQVWPFMQRRQPRIVDWLPWNHVFGGSHNFNLMLSNGGALYIDEGKPAPGLIDKSVRNITDIRPTIVFNVPVAYAMLVERMETDAAFRRAFFDDLDLIFYAGASLPADTWQKLEAMAVAEKGYAPLMSSSWGMTETSPANLMVHEVIERAGIVGVPLPGVEIKLLPDADMRCEVRVKGPNVMPGYFRDEQRSRAAFDEEGFLITGDAMRLRDANDPNRGLTFDGRIAEDFKLATGTWVHVSKLRLAALAGLKPLASDVVVTGHDREEIGLLIFPNNAVLKQMGITPDPSTGLIENQALHAAIAEKLAELARQATGSSNRIARAVVLASPASLGDGELTDKGNLNQQKILSRRGDLVARLYDDADPAIVRAGENRHG